MDEEKKQGEQPIEEEKAVEAKKVETVEEEKVAEAKVAEKAEVKKEGKGRSIASMVLGIVSVVFGCCFYYISIPCAIVGLVLGIISLRKKDDGRGMAMAGVITSIVSLALSIIVIVSAGAILAHLPWGDMLNSIENNSQ